MPKEEVPFAELKNFLPDGSFEPVMHYLTTFHVHLTVTRRRETILGDYRNKHDGKPHRISVNGNLNKFSFLITLLHEMAHLLTYERHGHRVQAHGKEWKHEFSGILKQFLSAKLFPADVEQALLKSIHNPAASSCGDENLLRVLKSHDKQVGTTFVEQLPVESLFTTRDGRIFKKGPRIRTRHKCQEVATGKWFLFSGVYEVKAL